MIILRDVNMFLDKFRLKGEGKKSEARDKNMRAADSSSYLPTQ